MEEYVDGKLLPKFRVIMLGSAGVGKTNIINQFINNNFRKEYYPTKDLM
jgi:GTPase SAR1 family protein